jgi:hypothetical protein
MSGTLGIGSKDLIFHLKNFTKNVEYSDLGKLKKMMPFVFY